MPPPAESWERGGPDVHNIWLLTWKQPTQNSLGVEVGRIGIAEVSDVTLPWLENEWMEATQAGAFENGGDLYFDPVL